ncbi:MAG: YabP/YqfC family sporulation protein [Clostridia bacterium]|nr:YabP/YqfC family sporulation protein [Clostridia bacterium]
MEQNKKHTILIEHGQGFVSTATEEVLSFNEKEMKISVFSGEKVYIFGDKLRINGFNKQTGELRVVGEVSSVKYSSSTRQKFKKLFG